MQEVTFERDHQFADTTGANSRRFGFGREIIGQVEQLGGVIFLAGIEQKERHLRFFATLHVVELKILGRETDISDLMGKVTIIVDDFLHHFPRKAQAACNILGVGRDIHRLVERAQGFRVERHGECRGGAGGNRLLVPCGHCAGTVCVDARHQQWLIAGVANFKVRQGRHFPHDIAQLYFGSQITCLGLCGCCEETHERKEERKNIAKGHKERNERRYDSNL